MLAAFTRDSQLSGCVHMSGEYLSGGAQILEGAGPLNLVGRTLI